MHTITGRPSRVVYTVGEPESGNVQYDIQIHHNENTVPDQSTARIVAVDGTAYLQGRLDFDGANSGLDIQIPEALWPSVEECLTVVATGGGVRKPARVFIMLDGWILVEMFDGSTFANGDFIEFGGSYLLR